MMLALSSLEAPAIEV